MIVKSREAPRKLQALQALIRRIDKNHPKYEKILGQHAISLAGYKGEQAIDYPLSHLPDKTYSILHDLRLKNNDHYFQLDTLLIHPSFILILEVKNISGTLFFDQNFHQLIRSQNGEEEAFPDSIFQTEKHESFLLSWLQKRKVPPIPIHSFVVISNSRSVIKSSPQTLYLKKKIIRNERLPIEIKYLEGKAPDAILEKRMIKRIIRQILQDHTPLYPAILKQFQIKKEEIKKGVICPECSYSPMKRIHGTWLCSHCKEKSSLAHREALKDYSLLIDSFITNKEIREFLYLNSHDTAARIAKSMDLVSIGEKKGRVYEL